MKEFFLFVILILIPLYMVLRGLSVILPILVNSYRKDSFQFYNNWNSNRILWMLSIILLVIINSCFFGKKFFNIDLNYENFAECFVIIFLQVILLILFEFKMDNPFRPLKAYKYFRKKSFDESFMFVNNKTNAEKNSSLKYNYEKIFREINRKHFDEILKNNIEKFLKKDNTKDEISIENLYLLTQGYKIKEYSINLIAKTNGNQINKSEIIEFLSQIFSLENIFSNENLDRDRKFYLDFINSYILLNGQRDFFHTNDFNRYFINKYKI